MWALFSFTVVFIAEWIFVASGTVNSSMVDLWSGVDSIPNWGALRLHFCHFCSVKWISDLSRKKSWWEREPIVLRMGVHGGEREMSQTFVNLTPVYTLYYFIINSFDVSELLSWVQHLMNLILDLNRTWSELAWSRSSRQFATVWQCSLSQTSTHPPRTCRSRNNQPPLQMSVRSTSWPLRTATRQQFPCFTEAGDFWRAFLVIPCQICRHVYSATEARYLFQVCHCQLDNPLQPLPGKMWALIAVWSSWISQVCPH